MTVKPENRQNHLAAIHMAQKALCLSADDATALKLAVTGVASAADMTASQRRQYRPSGRLASPAAVAQGREALLSAQAPGTRAQQRRRRGRALAQGPCPVAALAAPAMCAPIPTPR